jgi:hypothetical protein
MLMDQAPDNMKLQQLKQNSSEPQPRHRSNEQDQFEYPTLQESHAIKKAKHANNTNAVILAAQRALQSIKLTLKESLAVLASAPWEEAPDAFLGLLLLRAATPDVLHACG